MYQCLTKAHLGNKVGPISIKKDFILTVSAAEYLGQRTDISEPQITPQISFSGQSCPFMDSACYKLRIGLKPICSVRKPDGTIWIVCKHRLCSTNKNIPLSSYQHNILLQVAQTIFNPTIPLDDILVKREEPMAVVERSQYKADYIMMARKPDQGHPYRVVLEMQGGGETSNTGLLTKHISLWEGTQQPTNKLLRAPVDKVGTIETNAWRRQQEQFIVKGNIAMQTGGGIAFCVGSLLYDYLWARVKNANLPILKEHNWTLALICFIEEEDSSKAAGPLLLRIDQGRVIFTSYIHFVQTLISQGKPLTSIFSGSFETLSGNTVQR